MKSFLLLLVIATLSCGQQPPLQPPAGQRCSGRNFNGRRCCTPEQPCGFGEGDCDGPLDGGSNDGHRGCEGNLVCGSNNCKKFGRYFHEKDDCCDDPSTLPERSQPVLVPGALLEPPAGQRCRGRNYGPGRRCCTPEDPCGEGEGDCDGAGDGGVNDGDRGCKRGLVCGSSNCKKFGFYYHEKDDCCEKPSGGFVSRPTNDKGIPANKLITIKGSNWGPWSKWSDCSSIGIKTRTQNCVGIYDCTLNNGRVGSVNTQERYCLKGEILLKGSDWGPWSKWSDCSSIMIKTRTQKCNVRQCTLSNGRVGSVNTQERVCFQKK